MAIKQRIDVGISGTATRTEHIEQTLHINAARRSASWRIVLNRMPGDGKIMRARILAAIRLHNNRGERMGHHIIISRAMRARSASAAICVSSASRATMEALRSRMAVSVALRARCHKAMMIMLSTLDSMSAAPCRRQRASCPAVDAALAPRRGDRRACGHRDGIGQPAVADGARTGGRFGKQRTHVERHRPDRRRDQSHDERRDDEPPGMSGTAVQNHRIHMIRA